ncbi:lysozyme (plasmid) [Rhizobium ruizarguesonis]|nr:lysozyme [Rhizobium ruizarguesonis]TBA31946.1 lysozyme [Rhizobium ruizarguesonis]TBA50957.1 lysozyme [Rhizobium ruizarguesonis]TBA95547.1 lysozyme [Rhizobium ruizarguesonis]TBB36609.1 lysozyme [Rhizobium ruizarguesonis]
MPVSCTWGDSSQHHSRPHWRLFCSRHREEQMAKHTMSKKGLIELIGHEAIVQTRYMDSVGVWTIGVGHTKPAGPPDPKSFTAIMSIRDVLVLYKQDLQKYIDAVNTAIKVDVSQTEFDALVSFHFNTGGIGRASLVKSLNAGDRKKAAKEFMNWVKPPEIRKRREKEQKLFADGAYSGHGQATVYPATPEGKVLFNKGKSIDLSGEDI